MARVLTVGGAFAVCFGLSVPFFGIYFLFDRFIFLIGLGSILVSIGLVVWWPQFRRFTRLAVASALILSGALALLLATSNVHIWGLFLFIAIPAVVLGLMLLVLTLLLRAHARD